MQTIYTVAVIVYIPGFLSPKNFKRYNIRISHDLKCVDTRDFICTNENAPVPRYFESQPSAQYGKIYLLQNQITHCLIDIDAWLLLSFSGNN